MQYFGFDRTLGRGNVLGFGGDFVGSELPVDPADPVDPVINPIPTDYILRYDFNGDCLDKSLSTLDGVKSGVATFVAGRKAGTQALSFAGGLVKTPSVVALNSDKATVSLWIKASETAFSTVFEFSENISATNAFAFFVRNASSVYAMDAVAPERRATNVETPNPLDWAHYVIVIDRSLGANDEQRVFKNGVLASTQHATLNSDLIGNFTNHVLHIGSNANLSAAFTGKIQDVRIYNRVLNEAERTQLFNE